MRRQLLAFTAGALTTSVYSNRLTLRTWLRREGEWAKQDLRDLRAELRRYFEGHR